MRTIHSSRRARKASGGEKTVRLRGRMTRRERQRVLSCWDGRRSTASRLNRPKKDEQTSSLDRVVAEDEKR